MMCLLQRVVEFQMRRCTGSAWFIVVLSEYTLHLDIKHHTLKFTLPPHLVLLCTCPGLVGFPLRVTFPQGLLHPPYKLSSQSSFLQPPPQDTLSL